jgi:hypothetical protein
MFNDPIGDILKEKVFLLQKLKRPEFPYDDNMSDNTTLPSDFHEKSLC